MTVKVHTKCKGCIDDTYMSLALWWRNMEGYSLYSGIWTIITGFEIGLKLGMDHGSILNQDNIHVDLIELA